LEINPHTTSTALSLLNSTVQSVKTAVELAKSSKDSDLKQTISEIFDGILDLKSKVMNLEEDNLQLRAALAEKKSVNRSDEFGYYFKENETSPLCPKCYEGDGKFIYLPNSESWNGGIRRDCRICRQIYWEKPMNLNSGQIPRTYNPYT